MGKKLAIKGHPTRGKEVIELLEMLGGKNNCDSTADNLGLCYLIDDEFDICAHYFGYDDYEDGELNIFTLEKFLEKYPFKVGDTVTVWVEDWENRRGSYVSVKIECVKWDDRRCEIIYVTKAGGMYIFFEAKDVKDNMEATNVKESKDCPKAPILSNRYDYAEGKCGYVIPAGYEFDCIREGFQTEIILKPKKPTYPTTYEGCCEVIANSKPYAMNEHYIDVNKLLQTFQTLLICRDAYWKIAGKEMGLDGPWKPDWNDEIQKYCIRTDRNKIVNCSSSFNNRILAFPTEEMRDAFYENFKDLIEQCKELL